MISSSHMFKFSNPIAPSAGGAGGGMGGRIEYALAFVFFCSIFLYVSMPVFSPDFWWHLATGKWMWANKSLMAEDPFNFVQFPDEPADKRMFVLRQYWLAQLLLYWVSSFAGLKGLIVLRAAMFTGMFFLVCRLMHINGAPRWSAALLTWLSAVVIVSEFRYVGIRPQMFSSMFAVMLLYLLERMHRGRHYAPYGMVALMLLWANMHGGFLFGAVIIGVYAVGQAIQGRVSRRDLLFYGAAILIGGLNPNGFVVVKSVLATFGTGGEAESWQVSMESQSLFAHASFMGIMKMLPYFAVLLGASLLSFLFSLAAPRKVRLELVLLYAVIFLMGLKSIRYIVFFASVAPLVMVINYRVFHERVKPWLASRVSVKTSAVASVVLMAAVVVPASYSLATTGFGYSGLRLEQPYIGEQEGAASFVINAGLGGNILNEYEAGGFLIWRLYPQSRVFSDGRGLYYKGFYLFRQVFDSPFEPDPASGMPVYQAVISRYDINTAILPGCDKVSGVVIPLTYALIKDPDWSPVYVDRHSIVFVRHRVSTMDVLQRYRLEPSAAYSNILAMALGAQGMGHAHQAPGLALALALGYNGTGQYAMAMTYARQYLDRYPQDPFGRELFMEIEKQLAQSGGR